MQLQTLTVLARDSAAHPLMTKILDGRIQEALSEAEDILGRRGPGQSSETLLEVAQLCGDLMLALGRAEEAEEVYRRAVKLAASAQRGAVRVVSCRSTGLMSLYQHRFGTASACFRRITVDEAATPAQKIEALCALAVARRGLGQSRQAMHLLEEACASASELDVPELSMLVSLVRVDLLVQDEVRAHDGLRDHVFWQSPRPPVSVQPLAVIDGCMAAHGHHDLVAQRLSHLRDLILAGCGDARAQASLNGHIVRLRQAGLGPLEQQARIETALVAIALRQTEVACTVLGPLQSRDAAMSGQLWNFELQYCLAKVCELMGKAGESMHHYQRYALECMQRIRAESNDSRSHRLDAAASPADDIDMRLPARYRRAYRYLLEHLDRSELTVREIADEIDVTERALQCVFKRHLGMTPGEVLQRCRVERIRADLLREDAVGGTVIETAARWGIRNRATLVSSYRKFFRETPSETLARRDLAETTASAG